MEQLLKSLSLSVLLLSSCSIFNQFEDTYEQRFKKNDIVKISELQSEELANVKKPIIKPVVHSFPTRRSSDLILQKKDS